MTNYNKIKQLLDDNNPAGSFNGEDLKNLLLETNPNFLNTRHFVGNLALGSNETLTILNPDGTVETPLADYPIIIKSITLMIPEGTSGYFKFESLEEIEGSEVSNEFANFYLGNIVDGEKDFSKRIDFLELSNNQPIKGKIQISLLESDGSFLENGGIAYGDYDNNHSVLVKGLISFIALKDYQDFITDLTE